MANISKCTVEGCDREVVTRGLCSPHYGRLIRHGDVQADKPIRVQRKQNPGAACAVEGCNKRRKAHGYCMMHQHRFVRYGDPLGGGAFRQKRGPCSVEGCDGDSVGRGLCPKHYATWRTYGDPTKAKYRHTGATAEWHVGSNGYVQRVPSGSNRWEYQHRVVMSQMIGRDLRPDESVHHKNGDRADNRPENLELWRRGQPAGQRVTDQVRWAREVLALYGNLRLPE